MDAFFALQVLFPAQTGSCCKSTASGFFLPSKIVKIPQKSLTGGRTRFYIRRREFEWFITELEKLPEAVSEFDDALWGSLVEYVTVGKDKTMVFTLIGGTEMKA